MKLVRFQTGIGSSVNFNWRTSIRKELYKKKFDTLKNNQKNRRVKIAEKTLND